MIPLFLTGCNGPLSPIGSNNPKNEISGDIESRMASLENNQNAIKLELARLQNQIGDIKGDNNLLQQGWFNIQSDGILIVVLSVSIVAMLLLYMFKVNKCNKMIEIMSNEIKESDDINLKERIMSSALYTSVEKEMFNLIK